MLLLTLISGSGLLDVSLPQVDTAILFFVKTMFIIAGVLYLAFAFLIRRQIKIMSSTISTTASPGIQLLGLVHLVLSLLVLIHFILFL